MPIIRRCLRLPPSPHPLPLPPCSHLERSSRPRTPMWPSSWRTPTRWTWRSWVLTRRGRACASAGTPGISLVGGRAIGVRGFVFGDTAAVAVGGAGRGRGVSDETRMRARITGVRARGQRHVRTPASTQRAARSSHGACGVGKRSAAPSLKKGCSGAASAASAFAASTEGACTAHRHDYAHTRTRPEGAARQQRRSGRNVTRWLRSDGARSVRVCSPRPPCGGRAAGARARYARAIRRVWRSATCGCGDRGLLAASPSSSAHRRSVPRSVRRLLPWPAAAAAAAALRRLVAAAARAQRTHRLPPAARAASATRAARRPTARPLPARPRSRAWPAARPPPALPAAVPDLLRATGTVRGQLSAGLKASPAGVSDKDGGCPHAAGAGSAATGGRLRLGALRPPACRGLLAPA